MSETQNKTQLSKKILIKGKIEALTGLLIGGTNSAMGIGGPDKLVIRNPISKEPYIPGSSLKGKMRALLEISKGYVQPVNMGAVKIGPSTDSNHITAVLFGVAITGKEATAQRPSRLICRDGKLLNGDSFKDLTELPYTETKTEVVIDRVTSAASPRTFERVPAGAIFELDLVLNVFEGDGFKEAALLNATFQALRLLQDDYLGGSGSRGSGRVKFRIERIEQKTMEAYADPDKAASVPVTPISIPAELQ